ncbi:MAG: deoxyribose-phosphate aldolase [Haemophilus parahaemolyticus]|uniref:deoxyribose-phosphate aldolase n=1 Tax=Haemophilus parahaemolyticus TaxID=735 RepID=UPI0026EA02A7|nr:deoxyribose-phosphate aldolase [Haemophilus parahaemolyticus]MBS6008386.1 deoxyribose-phosphate aldolase [Haemophilus parahaemolyticus]
MKKISLAALACIALVGCTAEIYSNKGDATVLSSKDISKDVVELTVKKDSGEVVTLMRKYDAHAAVGARINSADKDNHQDSDLNTIRRYEFK